MAGPATRVRTRACGNTLPALHAAIPLRSHPEKPCPPAFLTKRRLWSSHIAYAHSLRNGGASPLAAADLPDARLPGPPPGSPGAVAARMRVFDSSLVFVAAHLSAGEAWGDEVWRGAYGRAPVSRGVIRPAVVPGVIPSLSASVSRLTYSCSSPHLALSGSPQRGRGRHPPPLRLFGRRGQRRLRGRAHDSAGGSTR